MIFCSVAVGFTGLLRFPMIALPFYSFVKLSDPTHQLNAWMFDFWFTHNMSLYTTEIVEIDHKITVITFIITTFVPYVTATTLGTGSVIAPTGFN